MEKILLIEDDVAIITGLKYFLEQNGFEVLCATSKKEIYGFNQVVSLVVLDVCLPETSGFEVISFVKDKISKHVIFLTVKDDEDDVVKGFELGADDYVIKPFRPRELLSRINRVLKLSYDGTINVKNVTLDKNANKVFVDGKEVLFTALEFRILMMLFNNVRKVVTREAVLQRIWDEAGSFVNDNTLTVYIKRIRSKLPEGIIKTVKSVGYLVEDR